MMTKRQPTYRLSVMTHFASAHTLADYVGPCERLHGHNWKLEVEVQANTLDASGMAIDFKTIRKAAKSIAKQLDHRYINDIPPFDKCNPTAENIAAWFYQKLSRQLNSKNVSLRSVRLWETDFACVHYSEDNYDDQCE